MKPVSVILVAALAVTISVPSAAPAQKASMTKASDLSPPPKAKPTKRGPGFLGDEAPPPKEAEVWLTQLTVEEGRSTRAVLSERARWMVGPVRQN